MDTEGMCEIQNEELLNELDFVYLSAERIGVQDIYQQNLTNEYRIGIHGEYSFDYLSRERMSELTERAFRFPGTGANFGNQVDYWLDYITGYRITAEQVTGTEVVKVSYRKNVKKQVISVGQVGVYFFKLDENDLSRPIFIELDENGSVRNHEKGLFDQFDNDLDELLGL